ncbi:MAG: ferredoxin [Candidatus Burarchaeum sp.]|nr:ferredoxin [Candidatus Burarchaeum sp.]MDO8340324.1 ferredoxin [Candidatus Burarchaeum sp.]
MGKKYLVRYERGSCIGAGVCVVMDGASFEMNTDGKANLLDGKQSSAYFEKEIDESELDAAMKAAEGCPVRVIHIVEKDTGKQLA